MKIGSVTRRGARSFRIKVELDRDPSTGRRRHLTETIRGARGEPLKDVRERAKARLAELHHKVAKGEHVQRTSTTVKSYIEAWLENPVGINPKTAERYRQLAEQQIYPRLGHLKLQKLDESHLQD